MIILKKIQRKIMIKIKTKNTILSKFNGIIQYHKNSKDNEPSSNLNKFNISNNTEISDIEISKYNEILEGLNNIILMFSSQSNKRKLKNMLPENKFIIISNLISNSHNKNEELKQKTLKMKK
ncbi:hypothetical protein H8356DRAFT_1373874 [Neocallimastix lanati (nom. inval.)]|uniref:Uncharacterized protein n=1 Tax=Neocallimastix californiae TaxID=1754190 RepID=A0A1Y2BYR7_9FUNG|nr:hypothetical protein H8356DRAFT_1373874 [Neocallimastix sp. JGI-2020a]ORY39215.1 hypothetical protein LY90DRAFT_510713 [Neocallimastix californiae]|eukprot:ORY39215.1 hypothetical protein LY90DRAFT_510713 [Neocallimastix californiae]